LSQIIKANRTKRGVHVPHHKNTNGVGFVEMPTPEKVTVAMSQNIGAPCTPVVKNGEMVKIGQLIGESTAFISAPIYAPIAGKVSLSSMVLAGGQTVQTVVITRGDTPQEVCEDIAPPVINSREDFIAAVKKAGLVGLGGAGFPTSVKLSPKNLDLIDTIVLNGAECEPYITADYQTMMHNTDELYEGLSAIMKYLGVKRAVIGVENNKKDAIEHLAKVIPDGVGIEIASLPARYPQGAEKTLLYQITGRVVPEGKLPADVGVLVFNVTTVVTIARILKTGMPLITRGLTVDGSAVAEPKNVIAPIGTSIADIIAFCGGYKEEAKKILLGGPMMGSSVPNDTWPITKTTNAILAFGEKEATLPEPSPCIRCGRCVTVCPMQLTPATFEKKYLAGDLESLKKLKIGLCIECGCCAYTCPAKRNLVHSIRMGKQALR